MMHKKQRLKQYVQPLFFYVIRSINAPLYVKHTQYHNTDNHQRNHRIMLPR